jgi:signal transduction histidine kinase/AraC-like DNA-binding protein
VRLHARPTGARPHFQRSRIEQHETAAAIGGGLGGPLELHAFVGELIRFVRDHYAYDQARIFLWSAPKQRLCRTPADLASSLPSEMELADAGPLRDVLESGTPVLLRSRAILPIHFGSEVIGVLDLHSQNATRHPLAAHIGLQSLADQVGVGLHNCELYAEALRARQRAETADRIKTRLLANVSHELRAPLNVILGYSQAALAVPNSYSMDLPAGLRHDLEHIYDSGDHLMRLINDLLDLSRAEVDALDLFPAAIAPRHFLEEVFQSAANHRDRTPAVIWRLELTPHLPVIQADPVRLRQVLDNLLNNARASTTIGEIVLGADVEARHLHVWVRDTGEGIPAEQRERVFEAFVSGERAGRRRKGIGLGLTITRRLVALHGGTLALESEPGRGSTFHVRLPLSDDTRATSGHISVLMKPAARQAVLGAIEALQPASDAGTVLIVDDDPDALVFYSRLVSKALPDCRIATAANGSAALRLVEQLHEPPTLVIADLMMPEIDGLAVLERLRGERNTRHVPVLVVSGRLLSPEDVRRLDHARVLYQTKDLLSPNEVLAVLRAAADGRALLPQPTSALVKQALAYLHAHYSRQSLARHDIAMAIGVSENYLGRIFHSELGLSPREYLSRLRIRAAKDLLSSTRDSVTTIAGRVGFEDPAYFSRVFHKLVGESPHTYRQRA